MREEAVAADVGMVPIVERKNGRVTLNTREVVEEGTWWKERAAAEVELPL